MRVNLEPADWFLEGKMADEDQQKTIIKLLETAHKHEATPSYYIERALDEAQAISLPNLKQAPYFPG